MYKERAMQAGKEQLIWIWRGAGPLLGALMLLSPSQAFGDDFLGRDFEEYTGIPRDAAAVLDDTELDDLRGRFLGFFFSVHFEGFVGLDGATQANLDVNAGLGGQTGTINLTGPGTGGTVTGSVGPAGTAVVSGPGGEQIKVAATIANSAFSGGGNIIAQVNQVPGNQNVVANGMTIFLTVINAPPGGGPAAASAIAPLFGF
jgi:hypothetical protein